MKSPKLLPWLARSAGLSDARIGQLWLDATQYAANATGEHETHRYWKVAHERLIDLVDAESMLCASSREAAPWIMLQTHISMGALVLTGLIAEVSANLRSWLTRASHHPV
ncbi:MAG: hypothetical protein M0P39_09280 [Rhodocyclaceae bacterium]|jgi:hypothetical protein|nr:hypothetical protein [Rhodocyclaceae bacterium]